MMNREHFRTASLAFTLLVACEISPTQPPLWAGAHVQIYSEIESSSLCVGSLLHLDRYVEQVITALGEPAPSDLMVTIRLVDELPCPPEATGCYRADDDAVYLRSFENMIGDPFGVLRHEISHAVVHHLWGPSVPFFREGLAEAFSRSDEPAGVPNVATPVESMLGAESSELDYIAAGRFTRYLIDTYGVDRFKRLYRETKQRSRTDIMNRISEIYSRDFAEIEADYLSGAPRCLYQLDTCDYEAAISVSGSWSSSFAVSCEDPSFYGTIGGPPESSISMMTTVFVLEIAESGPYILQAPGPVTLVRCGPCSDQFSQLVWGSDVEIDFSAGYYSLQLDFSAESEGIFSLDLVSVAE